MNIKAAFVSNSQPSESVDPGEASFDALQVLSTGCAD